MDIGRKYRIIIEVYRRNFWPLFLGTLTFAVICGSIFPLLSWLFEDLFKLSGTFSGKVLLFFPVAGTIAAAGPLLGGLMGSCLKLIRGIPSKFEHMFAYLDKTVPTSLSLIFTLPILLIMRIALYIPWAGPLFNLIILPVLVFILCIPPALVVDKKLDPLSAATTSAKYFLADPKAVWLDVFFTGLLSCSGLLLYGIFSLFLMNHLGMAGWIVSMPVILFTMPINIIGLALTYQELSVKDPQGLKINKTALQFITAFVVVVLICGMVCRAYRGNLAALNPFASRTSNSEEQSTLTPPPNFPADIPVYPNARIEEYLDGKDNNSGIVLTLVSKDDMEKVFDHFSERLKAKGWILEVSDMGRLKTIGARKNARECNIMINQQEMQTDIIITVGR